MAWQDHVVEPDTRKFMWEILVPTERRLQPGKFYTTRFHKVWDAKVRAISGGLTVLTPAKGQWVSPAGELFSERMIPVRIMCTRGEIDQIIDMTMEYYDQLAILCTKISEEVILRHACDKGCRYAKDVGMPEQRCANGCMLEKQP
jgi:hypothetical protein